MAGIRTLSLAALSAVLAVTGQGAAYGQSPGPYGNAPDYGQQPVAPAQGSYPPAGAPAPYWQQPPPSYPPPADQGYAGAAPVYRAPPPWQGPAPAPLLTGRVVQAPAGLIIPVSLQTAISTQVAKPGDFIQAQVSQDVYLADGRIPAGSTVSGQVTDASAGKMLNRTGRLTIAFNQLRTPDGAQQPITAHLVGDIGKYALDASGQAKGEGWGRKLGGIGLRTAVGAGGGAALGTAMGAIVGGSIGTGAWAGTAIGGGLGLAESLVMRKGRDVIVPSGTSMQLQLDQPVNISL